MNLLITNFPIEEEQDVRECLKIAKIEDYSFGLAFDQYGNELSNYMGLYLPYFGIESKSYQIEMYYKTRRILKKTLMDEYKKLGYDILPCNVTEMRLNMDENYLNTLCTTDIKKGNEICLIMNN